ncbi:MAG: isoprenylcysteine carboxylmethyltransferase family protein [Gemmatimonadales bacterium]|jgi:protein-S-isoprenylcysteine O-methyltransferase Ste14
MELETYMKVAFGVMAVMILSAVGHANHKAQKQHGARFAQAANELPWLLWIRALLGIPLWVVLIGWLISARWLPWALVELPVWARWSGVALAGVVSSLFWWTHLTLGGNYHGTMGLHKHHQLVTNGPYRFVRHPTYVAFPLTMIALFLLSSNWLLGLLGFILTLTISLSRAPIEERQLLERFGDRYRGYAARTGRFFPRLRAHP